MKQSLKLVACMLLAIIITGCCSEKEKKEVGERIEKRIQEMRENCERIQDPAIRDQCFADINPLIAQMEGKYLDYLAACEAGDTALAKQILEELRRLLSASKVIATMSGDLVNNGFVLFPDDLVQIDVTVERDFETAPIDLVKINNTIYMPDAAGKVSINRTDPSESDDTLELEILRGNTTANYEERYTVDGALSIMYDGTALNGTASGEIWITPGQPTGTGNELRSVPSRMTLTMSSTFLSFDLLLDRSCPHNELIVGADGTGMLHVFANVRYHGGQQLPPLRPYAVWLKIPVVANGDWSTIDLTTGGDWFRGTDIAPVGPFPVADFDDNGIVDENDFTAFMAAYANLDPSADVNYDGAINQADFDYFDTYWQLEMEE